MARKSGEVNDWLKKGVAIGVTLLSKKEVIQGIFEKLYDKDAKTFHLHGITDSIKLFGRMMKAFFKGEYKQISPWLFINTAIGITYLVSDVDLIPDSIPIAGVVDDAGVIMWIISTYSKEIEKYEMWEAGKTVKDIQVV